MKADGRGRSQCLTPAPRRQRGPGLGPRSHHLDDAPLHGGDRGSPGGAAALRGGGHVWSWKGSEWGGRPGWRCQDRCRRWGEVAATRSRQAGDRLPTADWMEAPHTKAAAGLRAKEETRSPPPPHVLLAAQACQSATALRPISVQNPPDLKPIGTLFVKPRPLVPKRVGSSRKR